MCLLKKTDNFEDCDHPDYIELFKLLNSHITNPTQRSTLEISSNRTYEGDVIKGVEQTSGGLCIVPNEEKESLDRNHLFVWNTGDFKHFIAHTEPHPSSKDKDSKELQDLINTKLTELGKEPRSIFPHKLRNNSSDRISASFDKSDYEMARDDRFEDIEVHIEQLKAEVDSILLLLKQKEKEEILNEVKDEPNDTNLAIPQDLRKNFPLQSKDRSETRFVQEHLPRETLHCGSSIGRCSQWNTPFKCQSFATCGVSLDAGEHPAKTNHVQERRKSSRREGRETGLRRRSMLQSSAHN
eukprot:TRINITY_DN3853_c0_g1_i6.p1 TRINITY_DN3853_c0_g1~~TRINITY_DN3853_c0_g1_i6.p1  ORF type:complete len:297 (-),score=40.29 TRINITY_DN3853_c0_g1_i6:317-1207(-)